MSLRTSFIQAEINSWIARIRKRYQMIQFAFAMRPLRYRIREFWTVYGFGGVASRWRREKQALANAQRFQTQISERQRLCAHMKGGRFLNMTGAPRPITHTDYNVSMHAMINNRRRIICNYCKRKWWEGDPDWAEALRMVQMSSNQPSSSEIPSEVLRGEHPWTTQPTKSSSLARILKRIKNVLTNLREKVFKS